MSRTAPDGRTSRRKPRKLTKELIVDAAIRLLREVGTQNFSVRALAKELDVTPMAIYRHVPNKAALLAEVRETLLSLVPLVVESDAEEKRVEQPLSEQDIITEALALVREQELGKLSMRALARRLGVSPMAIYRHVPNKATLLSRMTDVLIEQLPQLPPSRETWVEDFRSHARLMWEQFSRYPGLVGAFASGPSDEVLAHMAYEHSIFLASGADRRTAALAVTVYHTFLLGLFRTHAYLAYLSRVEGGKTGVSTDAIRRYGDRLLLTEILDCALDSVVAGVEAASSRAATKSKA